MATQTQNADNRKNSRPNQNVDAYASGTGENALSGTINTLMILAALKYFSGPEKPMSPSEVHDIVFSLRDISDKTIKRRLEEITSFFEAADPAEDLAARLLRMTFGGSFHVRQNPGKRGHRKYYFQPLVGAAHTDMINSSIISNQYLSDTERSYLIQMVSLLGTSPFVPSGTPADLRPNMRMPLLADVCNLAPEHPAMERAMEFELLQRINLLYRAVTEGRKISMCHGRYQKAPGNRRPVLVPQAPERPYHLNPYALFFNEGHHYLLATKSGERDPWHFRIDRICSVEFLPDPKDATKWARRDPRPANLDCYWDKNGFDQTKYCKFHPLMAVYDTADITYCSLKGNSTALSVIIDAFGKENVLIKSTEMENGKPVFVVQVGAQYQSLVFFCAQQHMLVTVLSPDDLIRDTKAKLLESLNRYE